MLGFPFHPLTPSLCHLPQISPLRLLVCSAMSAKRARKHIDHIYAGEEQLSSLALKSVRVTVVGKRGKARVVTKLFRAQRTDKTDNPIPSTPEVPFASTSRTPVQVIDDPISNDDGDVGIDHPDTQDTPLKKVNDSRPLLLSESRANRFSQTAYARIQAFLPHLGQIQQSFMAQETEVNVSQDCSSCGLTKSATYRCLECFNALALCATCIVTRHHLQPLHQIQMWTGTYFDAYTLHSLGLVMYLGHGGAPCPASVALKEMVIIHTNGIHRRSVQFCDCNDLTENFQQLMILRLFPATLKFPATAFTFDLLETFHQLTLCSKITPYDYFDTLKKLTNLAFPQDVDVSHSNHDSGGIYLLIKYPRTGTRS